MKEETRWGIVYCPRHNAFRSKRKRERLERILADNNIEYDIVQSENESRVEHLVRMFVNNGYRTIVIVGGDTALHDTVNTMMLFDASIRDRVAIGIIPNGVMNDFAHFWNMHEGDEERIIKALKNRRIRKIDVANIRYVNKHGDRCKRYFVNCINIGLIATIMNLRRKTRNIFLSRTFSFIVSFILMIFQRLDYKMHIKINRDVIRRKVMTVCIGNSTGYGQTPNAVPYNGQLDVSVVYHPEIMQFFEGIYLFVRGKFLNHRSVHPYRTDRVEVIEAEHAMISIDGRLMKKPSGSFVITVEQEVLNFIMPV